MSLQESYNAGVKHYEADDFEAAIKYFEQALREYYNEDMECRALCEGPQRFEEYEYLGYKGGLYEAIAGKACFGSLFAYSKMLWISCKMYSDNIVLNSKDCNMLIVFMCLFRPICLWLLIFIVKVLTFFFPISFDVFIHNCVFIYFIGIKIGKYYEYFFSTFFLFYFMPSNKMWTSHVSTCGFTLLYVMAK